MRTLEAQGDEFYVEDGLRGNEGVSKSEKILASEVRPESRLLVVEPDFGFLPVQFDDRAAEVKCLSRSARSCRITRKNLELNGVEAEVQNSFYAEKEFDTAVYAPPTYESIDVVRDRLSSLVSAGGAGSEIVLCGPKKSGINRYSQFLSSCGDTENFSRSGNVVVKCEIESKAEGTRVGRSFSASARGQTLEFRTRPGLFSYGELDAGTRTLLEELTVEPGEEVLDLGCGYGAVGCFLSSDTCVSATMSDDDCLAASYASENLGLNGLSGQALVSDAFHGIDQSFDLIASNPPTHAGDGVLRDMLTGAEKQLRGNGRIVMVHRKELDLSRFLSTSVSLRQRTKGFKVVEARY